MSISEEDFVDAAAAARAALERRAARLARGREDLDASDLVQVGLLHAWEHRAHFNFRPSPHALTAWIQVVAASAMIDELRRFRRPWDHSYRTGRTDEARHRAAPAAIDLVGDAGHDIGTRTLARVDRTVGESIDQLLEQRFPRALPLLAIVEDVERALLERAGALADWNQTRMAALLEVPRDLLKYRMKRYGMLTAAARARAVAPAYDTSFIPTRLAGPPVVVTVDH